MVFETQDYIIPLIFYLAAEKSCCPCVCGKRVEVYKSGLPPQLVPFSTYGKILLSHS